METIELSDAETQCLQNAAIDQGIEMKELIHKILDDYIEEFEENKYLEERYEKWGNKESEIGGTLDDLKKELGLSE